MKSILTKKQALLASTILLTAFFSANSLLGMKNQRNDLQAFLKKVSQTKTDEQEKKLYEIQEILKFVNTFQTTIEKNSKTFRSMNQYKNVSLTKAIAYLVNMLKNIDKKKTDNIKKLIKELETLKNQFGTKSPNTGFFFDSYDNLLNGINQILNTNKGVQTTLSMQDLTEVLDVERKDQDVQTQKQAGNSVEVETSPIETQVKETQTEKPRLQLAKTEFSVSIPGKQPITKENKEIQTNNNLNFVQNLKKLKTELKQIKTEKGQLRTKGSSSFDAFKNDLKTLQKTIEQLNTKKKDQQTQTETSKTEKSKLSIWKKALCYGVLIASTLYVTYCTPILDDMVCSVLPGCCDAPSAPPV